MGLLSIVYNKYRLIIVRVKNRIRLVKYRIMMVNNRIGLVKIRIMPGLYI